MIFTTWMELFNVSTCLITFSESFEVESAEIATNISLIPCSKKQH
jgi:hypothetical protein